MTFKELCISMQQYAEKLEREIKIELNDLQNLLHSNELGEVKLALETAKNYHYEEITIAILDMFRVLKKIRFHMDKIEWLCEEKNIDKEQLRRFSYVRRQIFAFSNNTDDTSSRTSNLIQTKREKRRSAAEVSIGSLDAWEKYLEQKEHEQKTINEKMHEVVKPVLKRKPSNAKIRKKFVSSTMGEFLDKEQSRSLEAIFENAAACGDTIDIKEDSTSDFGSRKNSDTNLNPYKDEERIEEPFFIKKYSFIVDKSDDASGNINSNFSSNECPSITIETNSSNDTVPLPNNELALKIEAYSSNENKPTDHTKNSKLNGAVIVSERNSINNEAYVDTEINSPDENHVIEQTKSTDDSSSACNTNAINKESCINTKVSSLNKINPIIYDNIASDSNDINSEESINSNSLNEACEISQPVNTKPRVVDVIYKKKP